MRNPRRIVTIVLLQCAKAVENIVALRIVHSAQIEIGRENKIGRSEYLIQFLLLLTKIFKKRLNENRQINGFFQ